MRDYRFRVSVRNRFGVSDPSPYAVAHRSNFADDVANEDPFLAAGQAFDLSTSTRYIQAGTPSLCLKRHEVSEKIGLGSLAHFILDMKQRKLKCKKNFKIHAELTKLLMI